VSELPVATSISGRAPVFAGAPRAALLRVAVVAAVLLAADVCAASWLVSPDGGRRSPALALQLVAALIVVHVFAVLNERGRLKYRALRRLSSQLRELAIAEERNRLAREIHDGLGGVLSSVVIQSEYLLNMIDGSEVRSRLTGTSEARAAIVPVIRKELADLHQAADDAMDELRRSLRMMQEGFDLVAALEDYCQVAAARHRLEVRFVQTGPERAVTPECQLALFRVLQEALTNVAKHCDKGTVVEVALGFEADTARLSVHDHGKGFAIGAADTRTGHYGLANMRERARKVDGTIRMQSEPGQGTTIELSVPAGGERSR
jgi:signal transduction histidine kinase